MKRDQVGRTPLFAALGVGVVLLGGLIAANRSLAEREGEVGFDSYGGNRAIVGEATGFFHLDEIGGRHYLITPEGHAFRALGINHFHRMTSRDFDGVIRRLRDWGFNAGCYQGPFWMRDRFPYTKGITLVPTSPYKPDSHFGFRDVFDPDFLTRLEESIRHIVEPQSENPLLIGYFWTDIGVWERERKGESWLSFYRELPPDSPGGAVWRQWKEENPDADESGFLALIARQLYARAHQMVRKYDKNHLILGDRWHEIDMPEAVVRESLPYVDAISIQPTSREFNHDFFRSIHEKYGKPIYIADHVSSFATEEHPVTMGQKAQDPEAYVAYYESYVTTALAQPYLIGFHKCQYQDEITGSGMLKQGLVRLDERLYPTVSGIGATNRRAMQLAYQAGP